MGNQWDDTIEDIVGAFRVFMVSAIVIYVALAVTITYIQLSL